VLNSIAIRIWRSLFSYQIYMVLKPEPSLDLLLRRSKRKEQQAVAAERAHAFRTQMDESEVIQ
jgi:hypothetical protein